MKRIAWVLCACMILMAGIAHAGQIEAEEYAVYEAVFASSELNGIPYKYVVLERQTAEEQVQGERWNDVEPALIDNFNKKNDKPSALEDKFSSTGGLTIKIRSGEAESVFDSGRTWVSRVGFNADKTRALLYVQHAATPESGIAYFVFLDKADSAWKVNGSIVAKIF